MSLILFSKRQQLANAIERRMLKQERESGVKFTRGHFNTINQLMQMGWLRDRPELSERVRHERNAKPVKLP
jgi:hypothetical protein